MDCSNWPTQSPYLICEDVDPLVWDLLDPVDVLRMTQACKSFLLTLGSKRTMANDAKTFFVRACEQNSTWMSKWLMYRHKDQWIEHHVAKSILLTYEKEESPTKFRIYMDFTMYIPNKKRSIVLPITSNSEECLTEWYQKHYLECFIASEYSIGGNFSSGRGILEGLCQFASIDNIKWIVEELYGTDGKKNTVFIGPLVGNELEQRYALTNACLTENVAIIEYIIDLIERDGSVISKDIFDRMLDHLIEQNKSIKTIQHVFDCRNKRYPTDSINYLRKQFDKISARMDIEIRNISVSKRTELIRWTIETAESLKMPIDIHTGNDKAFQYACRNGELEIAQYLYELSIGTYGPINFNEITFHRIWKRSNIHVIQWILQVTSDIHLDIGFTRHYSSFFATSCKKNNTTLAEIVVNLCKQYNVEIKPYFFPTDVREKEEYPKYIQATLDMFDLFHIKYSIDDVFKYMLLGLHNKNNIGENTDSICVIIAHANKRKHKLNWEQCYPDTLVHLSKDRINMMKYLFELNEKFGLDFFPDIWHSVQLISIRDDIDSDTKQTLYQMLFDYAKSMGKKISITNDNYYYLSNVDLGEVIHKNAPEYSLSIASVKNLIRLLVRVCSNKEYIKHFFDMATKYIDQYDIDHNISTMTYHYDLDLKHYIYSINEFHSPDIEEWIKNLVDEYDCVRKEAQAARVPLVTKVLDTATTIIVLPFQLINGLWNMAISSTKMD